MLQGSTQRGDVRVAPVLAERFKMGSEMNQVCAAEQFGASADIFNAAALVLSPCIRIGTGLLLVA
ncbi:MAG: hypothetical protein M3Y57_19790 [Acidobacteriota bacterium]|nr:hypothetical protein [Acidobacteriota bacterium]